ncbi:MAG: transposase [Desulforhopalus sp.]
MNSAQKTYSGEPLSSEQACIAYLFKKRWPWGFCCPFCGAVQKEISPAYTVVCRYCRKQTSITAQTLMHGSKKSLAAWMRVAWQFSFAEQGLSARRLQKMMELSCYHTAWTWLQKMRLGAALAESAPCTDRVLIMQFVLPVTSVSGGRGLHTILALEVDKGNGESQRLRFKVVDVEKVVSLSNCIENLVAAGSTILTDLFTQILDNTFEDAYTLSLPTQYHLQQGHAIFEELQQWLATIYRGAIDSRYLQSYLDEFSFRHNSVLLQDRLAVLDHLLTALVKPVRKGQSAGSRG